MFEYKCKFVGDPMRDSSNVQDCLNDAAVGGWRLIETVPARYGRMGIFEREVTTSAVERADAKVVEFWLEKLAAIDKRLWAAMQQAKNRGDWDGSFDQFSEIAAGDRKVSGIGPKRRERLAELIEKT